MASSEELLERLGAVLCDLCKRPTDQYAWKIDEVLAYIPICTFCENLYPDKYSKYIGP